MPSEQAFDMVCLGGGVAAGELVDGAPPVLVGRVVFVRKYSKRETNANNCCCGGVHGLGCLGWITVLQRKRC